MNHAESYATCLPPEECETFPTDLLIDAEESRIYSRNDLLFDAVNATLDSTDPMELKDDMAELMVIAYAALPKLPKNITDTAEGDALYRALDRAQLRVQKAVTAAAKALVIG